MKRFVHEASPMDMLDAFENKLDDLKSSEEIEASTYDWDEEDEERWQMLEVKRIYDWDGFHTDYSLWKDNLTGDYACFYGDTEIYNPENGTEPDEVFGDENSAYEWFDNYQ